MPLTPPKESPGYITLDDFSPGIFSRNQQLGSGSVPAKLGAAQATNTYRCVALPGGGLGPLPKRTATWSISNPEGSAPTSGYWIVGFIAFGNSTVGVGSATPYFDNLFVPVAYFTGGKEHHRLYRLRTFDSPFGADTLKSIDSAAGTDTYFEASTFATTRMNPTSPYLTPGIPVVVATWETAAGAHERYISVFPNPSSPGTTGMLDLSTSRSGDIFGHQGRLVLLERTQYNFGAVGGISTNEQINFSDPPNSNTLGSQQEVFSQEFPTGVGAWGSISAGELLLIKHVGGGVLIQGDIANPSQVTRLPGVTGTSGTRSNRAASTPVGLFYASQYDGAWVWRGSDTSEKVSNQLDDNFLTITNMPATSGGAQWNAARQASFESWGNWVLATHNYLFDIASGGWWRIEDPSVIDLVYFSRGWNGQHLHAAPNAFAQGSATLAHTFDRTVPSPSYSWQSHPIPASLNRVIDIREIILLAQGSGTVAITLTALDGTTVTETFTITNTTQPQRLRLATECRGYNVVVRIVSDSGSSTPAPIVHSVALQTKERQMAVAA